MGISCGRKGVLLVLLEFSYWASLSRVGLVACSCTAFVALGMSWRGCTRGAEHVKLGFKDLIM